VTREAPQEGSLPEGLVCFVKRDCPTCRLVVPVLEQLAATGELTVVSQDDPAFPEGFSNVVDDRDLALSWLNSIESVPTLLSVENGKVGGRCEGWHRDDWQKLTLTKSLGVYDAKNAAESLPAWRPGCGSLSVEPKIHRALSARFEGKLLSSRRLTFDADDDEAEAMYARGWSDGLPLVPPTEPRVIEMIAAVERARDDLVAQVPPDLIDLSVEKAAINAVMAGCKPEYFAVVLAAVEAVCNDRFNMHGVLATTMPVAPILIVNGPIARNISMNSGINVFGQGNRANSTIGRALQLIVRNVGGGRPGQIDRATQGNPVKVGLAFAEDEQNSPWKPLCTDMGFKENENSVTAFCGEGPRCVVDQISRDPESLARTFAACLRTVHHPKLVIAFDALLAVSPEHARVFAQAGWSKAQLIERLHELLLLPMKEIERGAGGIAEGVPTGINAPALPKFRPGGILVTYCGGGAGMFSSIFAGWASGEMGSQPVTVEIKQ